MRQSNSHKDRDASYKDTDLSSLTIERVEHFATLRWLTTKEAATYLRTTVGGIHNRVYRGQLSYYRDGRKLLFKRMELDRLLEASRKGAYR